MTTNLCACGEPSPESTICGGCTRRLELALGDVPAIVADLETTIARMAVGEPRVGSRSSETPLPWHDKAAGVLRNLHGVLVGWVRLVQCEQANPRPWPEDRTSALAGWLLAEVGWLRLHEAAADVLGEVTEALREARRVVDRPAGGEFVGSCGNVVEGVHCTERLYAKRDEDEVRCRVCGAEYRISEKRKDTHAQVEHVLARPSEIIRAVGWSGHHVTKQQISRWVKTKRIMAKAHEDGNEERPLYRIGDVLELAVQDTQAESA